MFLLCSKPLRHRPAVVVKPAASFVAARKLQLEALLDELTQLNIDNADAVAAVTLDQTKVGRLSRMDALQGQEMSKEAQRRREKMIVLARAALVRIGNDEYGDCLECGEWINPKRLEMDAAAALCISCAQAAEQA